MTPLALGLTRHRSSRQLSPVKREAHPGRWPWRWETMHVSWTRRISQGASRDRPSRRHLTVWHLRSAPGLALETVVCLSSIESAAGARPPYRELGRALHEYAGALDPKSGGKPPSSGESRGGATFVVRLRWFPPPQTVTQFGYRWLAADPVHSCRMLVQVRYMLISASVFGAAVKHTSQTSDESGLVVMGGC